MASICVYEDEGYKDLLPLTWMRPTFDLRCGFGTLLEKARKYYPRISTYIFCRDYLADVTRKKYPGAIVNKLGKETSLLLVNGRVIIDSDLAKAITIVGPDEIFECEGKIVAARLSKENLELLKAKLSGIIENELFSDIMKRVKVTKINVRSIKYYFDLIKENGREIENDFNNTVKGGLIKGRLHQSVVMSLKDRIFIDDGATVEAFSVLDAKDGPIYIGRGAVINPHSSISGPAYIGERSVILGAKIRKNTSIGHYTKIGGEVSGTIFQGYGNKQHYGYIGDCYVGEWVNMGAGTTNSNLKNNYGNIKVEYMDKVIDSGQTFLGAAIADHTKLAIGTLINSGSVFGIFCNIFGGGMTSKFVPSFSWGSGSSFTVHELEKAVKTAAVAAKRRGIELTEADESLFRKVYELTEAERRQLR